MDIVPIACEVPVFFALAMICRKLELCTCSGNVSLIFFIFGRSTSRTASLYFKASSRDGILPLWITSFLKVIKPVGSSRGVSLKWLAQRNMVRLAMLLDG